MSYASRLASRFDTTLKNMGFIEFKTVEGFIHWYNRVYRRSRDPFKGQIKVSGTLYNSPQDVIQINRLRV